MTSPGLERITRELLLRKRLQEALMAFSRGVSARLALTTGLEALAREINALFGTTRTSIWIHDRRARVLALAASSDPREDAALSERISTTDDGPIARGLRQDGVHVTGMGAARTLAAPLRGWRRALGTLVIEGPAREVDEQQLIELSLDLARQLSIAVESVVVLEELIRQHRLLEDTFDSLAEMVVVTDVKQRAVQINRSLASRVGAERADLVDRPLEEVVGSSIAAWLTSPDSGRSEVATREFGGEQLGETIAATATPLVSQEGGPAGRVLVLRDITEQVQMRARLAQSEKLASLGQFIAGVAHEMNNPLQGVLGHLELMIGANADPSKRTDLRRIYNDAERAAKIVHNLLVFAGSQRSTRRRVNVEKLVARVIATREGAFHRPAVEIVHERAGDVRDVLGDAGLLHQALLNIVINAEQAIGQAGKKGRITLTTGMRKRSVVVTVSDTGPGIPADSLARIFDPFFTTKEVGQGTGLGLAIVYGVIQEHGGTITAANAPGGGAVFTIELPAAE